MDIIRILVIVQEQITTVNDSPNFLEKCKGVNKMNNISRLVILNDIFDHFQYASQWLPDATDSTFKALNKAESLIELLEANDCGSHGGFDPKNKHQIVTGFDLYDRFLTLLRKYKNEKDIKPVCDFTVKSLGTYYEILDNLREIVLNDNQRLTKQILSNIKRYH